MSMYWTIVTMSTVGYGDITSSSNFERIYASIIAILGVVYFSYANGAVSTILSNIDTANETRRKNIEELRRVNKEHELPYELYQMSL